jgi:hypothetical protein
MVMGTTQVESSSMLLLEANGEELNKGAWVHCWIEEVGVEKGEGAKTCTL